MKNLIPTTILLLSLSLAACGDPCLPSFQADTLILGADDVCFLTTDAETAATGSTISTSTGDTDTGGVTGGAVCEQAPGLAWGPCNAEGQCDAGPGTFCIATSVGNVCAPACGNDGCLDLGCDMTGKCLVTGACVPACDDATGCSDGMVCDPTLAMCVWPFPSCTPPKGELWGPCDDGACTGGVCSTGPDGANMCAPACTGNAPCEPDKCAAPSPGAVCQTSGICGYSCDAEHPCDDGKVCTPQGPISVCLWK